MSSRNKERDGGIYDDLKTFDFSKELQNLKDDNKSLKSKLKELKEQNLRLIQRSRAVEEQNLNLQNNISSLFKTATAEIDRKNRMIKELQEQVDSMKMKRMPRTNPATEGSQNEGST